MLKVRMGRVRGKMPETGYELNSEALFMKEAKGLTLRYFTEMVEDPDLQEDFFARRLNSSQVSLNSFISFVAPQRVLGS